LTAKNPVPVPRPPAVPAVPAVPKDNTLILTDKLDFDQGAVNDVIDLIDEIDEIDDSGAAKKALGNLKVSELTASQFGRLIEEAVEKALLKVLKR
jgi:hypothetical protein